MFVKAQPVWLKDRKWEMNIYGVFPMKAVSGPGTELHITGASFYRIWVNGIFGGFGPARTAAGYAREDIFPLGESETECLVLIEVAGYACGSLSTVLQPSFLMAEIQRGEEVLAYTGPESPAFMPPCRIREVERYSAQRHFCEVWDYRDGRSLTDPSYRVPVEVLEDMPGILDRRVPYPEYGGRNLELIQCRGTLAHDDTLPVRKGYSWDIPEKWGRFEEKQISYSPYTWIQQNRQIKTGEKEKLPVVLKEREYIILDFGRIEAGFLKADIDALESSDVVMGFSEYFSGDTFAFTSMNAHNGLEYLLGEGCRKEVMSFEPYTFRFVLLAVKSGQIRFHSFGVEKFVFRLGEFVCPDCENEILNSICRAAVRTFTHNAVDIYMDCPSRERAGWLCDSYFMAKTEFALTGDTKVEDAFLENYRLYRNRGEYPEGMLPMCYPSDKDPGEEFIPQWAMWYILEVEEYVQCRGHEDRAEDFKDSIYGLLNFFKEYENEDGLLERLPSFNFVEWSEANQWTWDVNYPTNFLYSQALECVWKLYGDKGCKKKSERIRKAVVEQSFNGHYFLDHAVRNEKGELCLKEHSSEACQYYAVLFGGISLKAEKYRELERLILYVFSPERKDIMPEIMEINAFIGIYLRLETLMRYGEYHLALRDVKAFFSGMEARTGTLWEYREEKGSYDHGFASYAFVVIKEALEAEHLKRDEV